MINQRKDKSKGKSHSKVIITLFAVIMFLASALDGYSAMNCGFQAPANSGTIGQGVVMGGRINISYGFTAGESPDSINVSIFATSPSTRNSTKATGTIGNISNSSATSGVAFVGGLDYVNYTLTSDSVVEDSNDYTLDCSCVATGGLSANCNSTRTSILFDRTSPIIPTSLTPVDKINNGSTQNQDFSAVIDTNTTTGCTLVFTEKNPGNAKYVMTRSASGGRCTLTINAIPLGDYKWLVRATDGTNTTDSSAINQLTLSRGVGSIRRKAIIIGSVYGSGATQGEAQKGLEILSHPITQSPSVNNLKDKLAQPKVRNTLGGVGVGALVGGAIGASGFVFGPLGAITTPVGATVGGVIGGFIGNYFTKQPQPTSP